MHIVHHEKVGHPIHHCYWWAMDCLLLLPYILSSMRSLNFDGFCFILMPITFTHILYKHFTGTGAIIRSFQCQWIYLELHHVNQLRTNWYHNYNKTGVGVTKPIFSVPLFSHFFRMIKTVVTCMISSSYLAGVTAAKLQRHLANMNMIEIIWLLLLLNQNFL